MAYLFVEVVHSAKRLRLAYSAIFLRRRQIHAQQHDFADKLQETLRNTTVYYTICRRRLIPRVITTGVGSQMPMTGSAIK
jgi:hypothetical protein